MYECLYVNILTCLSEQIKYFSSPTFEKLLPRDSDSLFYWLHHKMMFCLCSQSMFSHLTTYTGENKANSAEKHKTDPDKTENIHWYRKCRNFECRSFVFFPSLFCICVWTQKFPKVLLGKVPNNILFRLSNVLRNWLFSFLSSSFVLSFSCFSY